MKLTDHTYACNSLTNFYLNQSIEITRNRNHAKLLKLAWKNSWNHIKWTYFWRVFSPLKPLCSSLPSWCYQLASTGGKCWEVHFFSPRLALIEGDAAQARAAPSLLGSPAGGVTSRRAYTEFGATALKNSPVKIKSGKRGLSPLKPPSNDTAAIAPSNSLKKPPQKMQRNEIEWSGSLMQQDELKLSRSNTTATTGDETLLTSSTDSFGFTLPGKSQQTFPLSSHNSVVSDPSDFFSRKQTFENVHALGWICQCQHKK